MPKLERALEQSFCTRFDGRYESSSEAYTTRTFLWTQIFTDITSLLMPYATPQTSCVFMPGNGTTLHAQ
jgi:hypothetical protein